MNTSKSKPTGPGLGQSRLKLVFVFSLFIGPLLAAFIWYYGFGQGFLPKASVNNAPLVTPIVTIQKFSGQTFDQATIDLQWFQRKWTMVHQLQGECPEACQKELYNTRQVRLALGKDAHRVQRLIILQNSDLAGTVKINHPDSTLLTAGSNSLEVQLAPIVAAQKMGENDALLVDPLGNIMMVIPHDLDPGLLIKDMKKLLKLSHIG